jgi:hypothetical protein
MNFHFSVLTYGSYVSVLSTNPQLMSYDGPNGTAHWAIPRFWNPNITVVVEGATPATALYHRAFDAPEATVASAATGLTVRWGPGLAAFGVTFGLSYVLSRRRFAG